MSYDSEQLASLNAPAQRGHAIPPQNNPYNITIGDLGLLEDGQFTLIRPVARVGATNLSPKPGDNSQGSDNVDYFHRGLLGRTESTDIGIKTPQGEGQIKENQQHIFQQKMEPNSRIPDIIRKGVFEWITTSHHHSTPPSSPVGSDDLYVIGGWVKGCSVCGPHPRDFDFRSHHIGQSLILTMSVNHSPPGSRHSSPKGSPPRAGSPVMTEFPPIRLQSQLLEPEHEIQEDACHFLYYYKIRKVDLSERNLVGGLESAAGSSLSLVRTDSRASISSRFSFSSTKSRRGVSSPTPLPTIDQRTALSTSSPPQALQFRIPWNPVDIVLEYVHKTLLKSSKLMKEIKSKPNSDVFAVIIASHFDAEKLWNKWFNKYGTVQNTPPLPVLLEKFATALDIHTFEDAATSDHPGRLRVYASLCHSPKRDCMASKNDKVHVSHLENTSSNAFTRIFSRSGS